MARATRRRWWAALVAGLLLATACVPPAPPGPTAAKPTTQPAAAAPTAAPAAKPTEAPRPAATTAPPPSPTTAPAAKPTEPAAAAKPTTAPPTAAPAPAADPAVARGQEVYVQQCQVCHGEQGQGVVGPALIGPRANLAKFGPTARDLYDYVRSAMPQQAPGSLSAEQYVDVVVYLLAQNTLLPAGTVVNEANLASIRVER